MEQLIVDLLKKLELEHHIRIVYACQAGSRLFGTETDESDHDVCFIYLRPVRHYLVIEPFQQTITATDPDGNIELQGWDIMKALQLCRKSNPSLYEWFMSPHVYLKDEQFYHEMKNIICTYYSLKTLYCHYRSLALRNLNELKKKNRVDKSCVKIYIQALRGALMMRWIEKYQSLPPIELNKLADGNETMERLINKLISGKVRYDEQVFDLDESIIHELVGLDVKSNIMMELEKKEKRIKANQLNELLWLFLGI